MKELNKEELRQIIGGISISGTLLNSFIKGINVFLELGRSLGTAIRRIVSNCVCPL